MTGAINLHVSEVSRRLDLAVLLAVGLQGRELGALVVLVAGPLELVGPSLVAEPVADEVRVSSINEYRDLLEDARNQQMERLHPVTVEQEIPVDIEVAAVVAIDGLHAQSGHDLPFVEVLVDVAQSWVAEAAAFAVNTYVVRVPARLLIGTENLVVAVDGGWNTAQPALALVAAANHGLAPGQGIIHRLAVAFTEHSIVTTLTASHGAVVGVLSVGVSQAVANEHRLEVDVAVLVGEDFGGEDRDVVPSIRLACYVEVLLGVLRELFEKERQEGVDVLASSNGVADRAAAVRIANVDRLVQEDDGCVAVPGAGVVFDLDLVVDGGGPELEEEAGQRGAAWAAVEP